MKTAQHGQPRLANIERVAFTYKETGQALGLSGGMVRKMVRLGQIRVACFGRARRISKSEVLRLAGETKG